MARSIGEQLTENRVPEQQVKNQRILTVEITDPEWGETYTVCVTKKSDGWHGWVPDVPEVNECKETTKKVLLATLKSELYKVLEARADAWDKQIEEDIKAGKLEHLRKEALEDVKAGRFTNL